LGAVDRILRVLIGSLVIVGKKQNGGWPVYEAYCDEILTHAKRIPLETKWQAFDFASVSHKILGEVVSMAPRMPFGGGDKGGPSSQKGPGPAQKRPREGAAPYTAGGNQEGAGRQMFP
jgi:hypothetical protein